VISPVLQDILRHQYEAFMAAAARVADLHEATEASKEQYVALRNQATGGNETVEDLFEKEEKRRQRQKAKRTPYVPLTKPPSRSREG
jgi:hypothetical protein